MKKIPSLFKRDYEGNRQIYNEVVEGCQWVLNGEGTPTIKYDGTACMVRDYILYKRYDVKGNRKPPDGWEPCEPAPNEHTGHWPGWVPVSDGSEDQWFREAFTGTEGNGTYELVGPKVQGNPYGLIYHYLWRHGDKIIEGDPRTFEDIRSFLDEMWMEGIVWHHPDGRMAKIKRRDFGLPWPVDRT